MTAADRAGLPGSGRRHREPAETHFRRMSVAPEAARARDADSPHAAPNRFEVYRADEVRTSSTRFAGGDWRWRLCDAAGQVLVDAGGYRDEQACQAAIAALRDRAALASMPTDA